MKKGVVHHDVECFVVLLAMSWQLIAEPRVRVLSLCKARGKTEAWMGSSRRQHAEQAVALPLNKGPFRQGCVLNCCLLWGLDLFSELGEAHLSVWTYS